MCTAATAALTVYTKRGGTRNEPDVLSVKLAALEFRDVNPPNHRA